MEFIISGIYYNNSSKSLLISIETFKIIYRKVKLSLGIYIETNRFKTNIRSKYCTAKIGLNGYT